MGKLIDQLAPEYGFAVVQRLNFVAPDSLKGIEVAIEFSTPEAAPRNLKLLAQANIPSVTGTTGWLEHLAEVTEAFEHSQAGLVWSPNFSVGVAVFQKLAGLAAELLRDQPEYGAWAWEIHHDSKKDAPSGTLLHLLKAMERSGYSRTVDISSSRAGKHPGTHEIGFDSSADTITLRHTARSREGFARGALKAANWIMDRKGVYTFEQVLFGATK
jgi:4-hydroxy-tetrahydrodipicolinate reductase